jgi:hypothetical protein
MDEAKSHGWAVISMKNDSKRSFSHLDRDMTAIYLSSRNIQTRTMFGCSGGIDALCRRSWQYQR